MKAYRWSKGTDPGIHKLGIPQLL